MRFRILDIQAALLIGALILFAWQPVADAWSVPFYGKVKSALLEGKTTLENAMPPPPPHDAPPKLPVWGYRVDPKTGVLWQNTLCEDYFETRINPANLSAFPHRCWRKVPAQTNPTISPDAVPNSTK